MGKLWPEGFLLGHPASVGIADKSYSGAAAPVVLAGLALGSNPDGTAYWQNSQKLTDIVSGNDDNTLYWDTTANSGAGGYLLLPAAYMDANGNPTSMPPNGTKFLIFLEVPDAVRQYKMAWTDPTNDFVLDFQGHMTGISSITNHSFTYTPTESQPAGLGPNLTYHLGSNGGYPRDFTSRPASDDGSLLNPDWTGRLNTVGGPLRFYNCSTVWNNTRFLAPFNTIAFPIDGDGQLVDPIYTSANRNKCSWNLQRRDGMPLETIVAIATAANSDIHWCAPYNCDSASASGGNNANTYLTAAASIFAAFSAATGRKVYVTRGNEVWNDGFMIGCQNDNEATSLAVTREAHYALKAKEVFDAFTTAFTNAGVLTKLVRVLEWQNANGNTAVWDHMLAVTPADALSVAPYVGSNQSGISSLTSAFPLAYTGSMAAYWSLAKDDCDNVMTAYKVHSDYAIAHSLKMVPYEGGPEINFTSGDQVFTAIHDANYKDFTMYWLQEMEKVNPNAIVIPFVDTQRITNTDGTHIGGGYWGFREGTFQTPGANTPKWNGLSAYIAGNRSPQTLTGTLSIASGAANGSSAGTLKRTVRGATITFPGGDIGLSVNATTGAVTVADSTKLPAIGSYSPTIRSTHPGFPAPGYFDTTITLAVVTPLLTDNFNGASLDAAKWTTGIDLVNVSGSVVATSQTATQTGGQFVIGATNTANRGMSLISVANIDLAVSPAHYIKQVSVSDATTNFGMAFGVPGGAVLHINRGNQRAEIRTNDAGYSNPASFGASYPIATYPYTRIRYAGGNLHVDVAPSSAANPPADSDWVLDAVNTTWPVSVPTVGDIGVFYYNEFGVTPGNFIWDGFNTGT